MSEKLEVFIEGDGKTDQYGLRIKRKHSSNIIRGLTREEMNNHLKDLVDQFDALSILFDAINRSSVKTGEEI